MHNSGKFSSRFKDLKEKIAAKHKERDVARYKKGGERAMKRGGMAGFSKYASKMRTKEAAKSDRAERFRKGVETIRARVKEAHTKRKERTGGGLTPDKNKKGKEHSR